MVSFPFSRAKVLISADVVKVDTDEGESCNEKEIQPAKKSAIAVLFEVLQRDGVISLYQGLLPSLTKSVAQSAIMLMVREQVDGYTRAAVLGLFKR